MHLPAKPITFPFACYFFDYDYGNSSGGKITEKKTHQNFPLKQMTTRSIEKSLK